MAKNTHFTGLQWLRFIAALLVVIMHATEAAHLRGIGEGIWGLGSIGVDIFFVISGFVMALTTPDSPGKGGRIQLAKDFLVRRLIRIVPLYWFYSVVKVGMVLAVPSLAMRTVLDPDHVLASFLFLPSMAPWGYVQPVLPVGWTLNFEMFFYLVFALAIALGVGRLWFASLFFVCIMILNGVDSNRPALSFYAQDIVFEFILGVIIAKVVRSDYSLSPLVGVLFLIAGLCGVWWPDWLGVQSRLVYWGVPCAFIVFAFVALEPWFVRSVSWGRRLVFWGDASYSIYLSHSFAVPAAVIVMIKCGVGEVVPVVIFAVVTSMVVGALSYVILEKPMTDLLRKRFS